MERNLVTIPYKSKAHVFKLVPLGDVHIGNAGCDEEAFQAAVKRIADDPDCYTILMGDMIDAILPNDKRWDDKEVAPWMLDDVDIRTDITNSQIDRVCDMLSPIPNNRILGVLEGNHELTVRLRGYVAATRRIGMLLGTPYLGQECFVRLCFKRNQATQVYTIFATHGSGAGRKTGSKVNKIEDFAAYIRAHIYLMGHVHDRIASKKARLGLNKVGDFVNIERVFGITSSFLKAYTMGSNSYAARALYPPTSIGPIEIRLQPYHGTFEVVA